MMKYYECTLCSEYKVCNVKTKEVAAPYACTCSNKLEPDWHEINNDESPQEPKTPNKKAKKVFQIEWPDDYGPEWLCRESLEKCMFSENHIGSNVSVKVLELIEEADTTQAKPKTPDGFQYGWVCPVCGSGNAPWNPTCSHLHPTCEVSFGGGTNAND